MPEKTRYGVHIRSWNVPGAVVKHHQGRIWRYGGDTPRAEEAIHYPLTADEAAFLNKKDNDGWGSGGVRLRRGDMCARYSDRDRLVRDAVKRVRELWDYHGDLEDGDEIGAENPRLKHPDEDETAV